MAVSPTEQLRDLAVSVAVALGFSAVGTFLVGLYSINHAGMGPRLILFVLAGTFAALCGVILLWASGDVAGDTEKREPQDRTMDGGPE